MNKILAQFLPNASQIPDEFVAATIQTIYMSLWTSAIAGFFGILLGIVMFVTRPKGLLEQKLIFEFFDKLINIVRAIPFVILLALLATTTRFLVGTTIGEQAALVPLSIGVIPFFARQIENALLEVDEGVIEASIAMGLSPIGIIFRVCLREGLPGIVRASALTIVNVIGFTAMAGAVGAGGLGSLAISRGYNRFQTDITIVATCLILAMVFFSQFVANRIIKKISH